MGLLDRWTKRKQKETLEKADENKPEKKSAVVSDESKTKKASKTTKKEQTKEAVEEKTEQKQTKSKLKEQSNGILIRPLVTEKAAIAQSTNKYSFIISNKANKEEVKKAIKRVYKFSPIAVNAMNIQGKVVRFGRGVGRRSDYKKAIVTLKKGDTIVMHEGV